MSEIKANGSPVESGGRVEEVISVRVRKYFTRSVACQLLARSMYVQLRPRTFKAPMTRGSARTPMCVWA